MAEDDEPVLFAATEWRPDAAGPGGWPGRKRNGNAASHSERVLLAAWRWEVGGARRPDAHETPVSAIAHLDLARRRGRVDPDDEGHYGRRGALGDELVESLMPVALRRERLLVLARTSRIASRPPAGVVVRATRRPWRTGGPARSRDPHGSGEPSRPGSGRSACAGGRIARLPRRPPSGTGAHRSAACRPTAASSRSLDDVEGITDPLGAEPEVLVKLADPLGIEVDVEELLAIFFFFSLIGVVLIRALSNRFADLEMV